MGQQHSLEHNFAPGAETQTTTNQLQAGTVLNNANGLQNLYNWAPCGHFGLDARPECNMLALNNLQADPVPTNANGSGLQELYNWAPCGFFGGDARPECNLLNNLQADPVQNNAATGLQELYNWMPC